VNLHTALIFSLPAAGRFGSFLLYQDKRNEHITLVHPWSPRSLTHCPSWLVLTALMLTGSC